MWYCYGKDKYKTRAESEADQPGNTTNTVEVAEDAALEEKAGGKEETPEALADVIETLSGRPPERRTAAVESHATSWDVNGENCLIEIQRV